MSLHASPMMETPPMMTTRRSVESLDGLGDEMFDDRHAMKRPHSRASQV